MLELTLVIVGIILITWLLFYRYNPSKFDPHGVSPKVKHRVQIGIIGSIVGVSLFDLFLMLYFGTDATISVVIRNMGDTWSYLSLVGSFAVGALFGHFFLTPKGKK